MNSTALRALLGLSAALILGLWYFSQYPWSEFQSITSERNWSGYREFSQAKAGDEIGANFYLGGSFILLLAAAWIAKMALAGEATDRLAGCITLCAAILAIIALVRWNTYLNSFPAPTTLRYGSSGHYISSATEVCIAITAALVIVGTLLLFLDSSPKSGTTAAPESP